MNFFSLFLYYLFLAFIPGNYNRKTLTKGQLILTENCRIGYRFIFQHLDSGNGAKILTVLLRSVFKLSENVKDYLA